MLLYRPVGFNELRLLYQADLLGFPPRLPDQPIFYPVLNDPYARAIARDWNTKSDTHAGFVTRFSVNDAYASRFQRRVVGSREHEEMWVPAEELPDFNANLEGPIQVTSAFFGEGFLGEPTEQGTLRGESVREQLVSLAALANDGREEEVLREVEQNHQAIFQNYFFWEMPGTIVDALSRDEHARALEVLRTAWLRSSRRAIPLGVSP